MPTRFANNWLLKLFGGSQHTSWPEPAESTGQFLKQVEDVKFWTAKGPAVRAFEILSPDIVDHLGKFLDTISSRSVVEFYVFMRGDDPTTTYPVVMFTCEESKPRRQAQKILDESGLLDDFPGMRSDNAAYPPDSDCEFEQWASKIVRQHNEEASCGLISGSVSITGNTVLVNSVAEAGAFVRKATIGGFVQHDQNIYAYTAGHVFAQMMPPSDTRCPEVLQGLVNPSVIASRGVELSLSSVDLDYAFLKLPDPASIFQLNQRNDVHAIQPAHVIRAPLKDVTIIVKTTSAGIIKGTLSSTPAYTRLPHSKSFQKVFKGKFSQPLAKGDSGSWVINKSNHGLYGHVIGGGGRTAYIMPAHSVFEDAKQKLGGYISLPGIPLLGQADPSMTTEVQEGSLREPYPRRPPLVEASEKPNESPLGGIEQKTRSPTWPEMFDTRRDISSFVDQENTTWLELRAKLIDENGDSQESDDVTDIESDGTSIIRAFMNDDSVTLDWPSPDAYLVEEYCHDASLIGLESDQARIHCKNKAWLDEGGNDWFRQGTKCLTAPELYKALRRPRFWEKERAVAEKKALDDSAPNADKDIERRQIFVHDLDSWNIYALASTASIGQAYALRTAISKYLAFESHIGVSVTETGLPTFQLALHLPYYALRKSPKPRLDSRVDISGQPLRSSQNISLLIASDNENSYLYEAQISCVLSGIDDWTWVAYCFVDTYFEDEEEKMIQHLPKPEICGTHGRSTGCYDCPRHRAKSFFLSSLAVRARQICREWEQVIRSLARTIKCPSHSLGHDDDGTVDSVLEGLVWCEKTTCVLSDLRMVLMKTCEAWSRSAKSLTEMMQSPKEKSKIEDISRLFDRLDVSRSRLESLTNRCHDMEKQLRFKHQRQKLKMADQARMATESHYELALDHQRRLVTIERTQMTLTTSYPVALAAALFSMQPPVLPFSPGPTSFLITACILSMICLVVYHYEAVRQQASVSALYHRANRTWSKFCSWCWSGYRPLRTSRRAPRQNLPYSFRSRDRDPEKNQDWLLGRSASE